MDRKRYSLNDIFAILHESTIILSKEVTVVSGEEGDIKTPMRLNEYIAMVVADELTNQASRLACDEFTSSKNDVIKAMKANYFEEVAFPNYEYHGVILGGNRKAKNLRRTLKKK